VSEKLLSVGLDVGTTSTQMILSELTVENKAGSFSVPEMTIVERKIRYRSPIHFTPLLRGELVDAPALRQIIEEEYRTAGIKRQDVDTGAIIITGETSRKENAEAVLHELSGFAGDFVVATAGPDLESVLAAKGAGADIYSGQTGKTVLHMDIGGGTSNLALIQDGKILRTGCLNVGGRLLKFDPEGKITYVSPVLEDLCNLHCGQVAEEKQAEIVAQLLTQALEMAAGVREKTQLMDKLMTDETMWEIPGEKVVLSFSGGVADCIEKAYPWLQFGDLGPVLGRAIRESRLCQGEYTLGSETIRATVIGAGCHSTQLSGSTVFYQNVAFPLKNLPVVATGSVAAEGPAMLVIAAPKKVDYGTLKKLAEEIQNYCPAGPVYICMEQDMAKALGQILALRMGKHREILCIDRVRLGPESYLDVGAPVGPALPVVVKTLVLSG